VLLWWSDVSLSRLLLSFVGTMFEDEWSDVRGRTSATYKGQTMRYDEWIGIELSRWLTVTNASSSVPHRRKTMIVFWLQYLYVVNKKKINQSINSRESQVTAETYNRVIKLPVYIIYILRLINSLRKERKRERKEERKREREKQNDNYLSRWRRNRNLP
jgi:hypothetical protein